MFIIVFTLVGLCVFAYQQQVKYFFLFAGMGTAQAFCEWLTIFYPAKKQTIRRMKEKRPGIPVSLQKFRMRLWGYR